jgi:ABC-type glycerol-3-phosphate transport system substrate-binding protein
MRKWLVLVSIMLLALGVFSVRAQDATAEAAGDLAGVDPSGQEILYWSQFGSGVQQKTMDEFVADFNANNQWGIKVTHVGNAKGYSDISSQMNAAIVSGNLPNIVAGYPNDALSYDLEGVVVDLNTYYSDPKWGFSADDQSDLNQTVLNAFVMPDARRLGWPNVVSANVLAVNLGMLKQLGIDKAPETLDEFKAAACAAAKGNLTGVDGAKVQGYPIVADASQFESFVAGTGGSIFADGKWDFTSDKVTQVFQFLQDLYKEGCGYIPDKQFGNTADFALATNPMAQTSTAGIPFITGDIEKNKSGMDNWIVTTTPVGAAGDKPVLQVYTPGVMIIKSSPEKQLASWLFLKYLADQKQQVAWSTGTGYFPTRASAAQEISTNKVLNQWAGSINDLLSSGDVDIYTSPQNLSYGKVRGLLATAIADVTSGGKDVKEVVQKLTDDANAAMTQK